MCLWMVCHCAWFIRLLLLLLLLWLYILILLVLFSTKSNRMMTWNVYGCLLFQAIAIAGCFIDEGSILVVCPAVLRYSWAEEIERWLPFCLPADIHLGNIFQFELCMVLYTCWYSSGRLEKLWWKLRSGCVVCCWEECRIFAITMQSPVFKGWTSYC